MNRGDVVLVRFPHPSGLRGKKRPAVIVQADGYSTVANTILVAEVTKNHALVNDPACLFVDVNSIEGKGTGLVRDSVVSCLLLMTVYRDAIDQVLGSLSTAQTLKLNDCLKASLAIP